MGLKRKLEESSFSIELFLKKLQDPETSLLALSELNEYVRDNAAEELLDELVQNVKFNLNDVAGLITEEKRKASENITLYRFLTALLNYFSQKNLSQQSEIVLKKFTSIPNSIQTIYFMLSSHTTASHLKITLKFLHALTEQNEYYTRLIFSSIDFKRPFWKLLFKRRDIRDPEDVRYWAIKFFLSPLIYQNVELIRNLIKEQDIFHELFFGLQHDSPSTVQFVLHDIQTNIVMLPGMSKTDKLHLFNDRNLKPLLRCYNWTGPRKQKMQSKKKKKDADEEDGEEEMEVDEDSGERDEVRKSLHTFLMIVLNSKNYGIFFFDPHFGTSNKNSNPILMKVLASLLPHYASDEYQANLLVNCLRSCPDLLQSFFKLLAHEYLSKQKRVYELLCEILQQQKPLSSWLDIFQSQSDSSKLSDIFVQLTLPIDLLSKFEYSPLTIEFLCLILERIQQAFEILQRIPLACERKTAIEGYQQAILRYLPKLESSFDLTSSIGQYLHLLKLYSSECFLTLTSMNLNFEILLSNSLLNLLAFFQKQTEPVDEQILGNYFQCLQNLFASRESIDDVTWARQNKDLQSTPLRVLLQVGKQMRNLDQIAHDLSAILAKLSSMLTHAGAELKIWLYTWLKCGAREETEKFLGVILEKIILNPYPILEKQMKNTEYSLMIYSALDNLPDSSELDEYLCNVLVQLYIEQSTRPSLKLHDYLHKTYLKDRPDSKIAQLLQHFSPAAQIKELEKHILSQLDLSRGPDRYQINLALKLNLSQLLGPSSDAQAAPRLIQEIAQCLNILLLLDDPSRAFAETFDRMLDYLQSFSSGQPLATLGQIIAALDPRHLGKQPLRNSQILFRCLEAQPANSALIRFLFHYLSREYRPAYLHYAAAAHLDILLEEVRSNPQIAHENFLETVVENVHFDLEQTVPCALELIRRLKANAENTLRLKQKKLFKLTKSNHEASSTRILVSELIVQTLLALRSADRSAAIERLVERSSSSLLLHAHLFRALLERKEMTETEGFVQYLRELLKEHAGDPIVLELLKLCTSKDAISQLLQEELDFLHQTSYLDLFLHLYPTELPTAKTIYQSILHQLNKDLITEQWLSTFTRCTALLLPQIELDFDFKDLIQHLIKSFTPHSLKLLKHLLTPSTYQAKQFAQFLKQPHFLATLSSEHRATLLDLLARFVSLYHAAPSPLVIDCARHFPMLLAVYSPSLSLADQHTLACLHEYEKCGYPMRAAFLWGEAALQSAEPKSVLRGQSKLEEVLGLLEEKKMRKSIEFYPVTRRLRTIEPSVYEHGDDIYDPAYLIPVFYHSLGSESLVKCQDFVEKHCLSYCLMALSARCALLRAVVYNCLGRFEQHLFSQRFYCKEQLLTLFSLLKQSIKKANLKLAPIVALFLSKLVELFTHPESKIYRPITRFLLKQPFIDLVHIPLFAELFHSSSIEYKYERHWILSLLKSGIKDTIDYTLCAKAYVFKTLMTFYDCSLCDPATKTEILEVFRATSRLQEVLMPLLFDYGFLLWLQLVIKTSASDALPVLTSIVQNIGQRLSASDHQVQLLEFSGVLMLCLRRLRSETQLSSALADPLVSTLLQYREYARSARATFGDLKFLVDCSTVEQRITLLSCFC